MGGFFLMFAILLLCEITTSFPPCPAPHHAPPSFANMPVVIFSLNNSIAITKITIIELQRFFRWNTFATYYTLSQKINKQTSPLIPNCVCSGERRRVWSIFDFKKVLFVSISHVQLATVYMCTACLTYCQYMRRQL